MSDAKPYGDFPIKHPASGPVSAHPPTVPSVNPTENGTAGRVYTMASPPSQTARLNYANRSAQVLEGYAEGLVTPFIEAGKLAAKGIGSIVTEPVDTAKALAWGAGEVTGMAIDGWQHIISDPDEALDAFVWAAKETVAKVDEILSGDPKEAGKLVGEVVSVVSPVGVAKARPKHTPKPAPTGGAVILRRPRRPIGHEEHRSWLESNGYKNVDNHLKSSDPSKPVELVRLETGDEIWMYVRDGGKPGAYATLPGVNADSLAIESAGRHLETFKVATPFDAISSTAAEFPTGVYPGVGGTGGGTQLQLPSDFISKVERVAK